MRARSTPAAASPPAMRRSSAMGGGDAARGGPVYAAPRRRGRRSPRPADGRARRMATAAPTAAGRDAVPAAAQRRSLRAWRRTGWGASTGWRGGGRTEARARNTACNSCADAADHIAGPSRSHASRDSSARGRRARRKARGVGRARRGGAAAARMRVPAHGGVCGPNGRARAGSRRAWRGSACDPEWAAPLETRCSSIQQGG